MEVYNKTIFSFISKLTHFAKEILSTECNLIVKRNRFQLNNYLYPLKIIIFTGQNKIGYFEQSTYQIGLNENLLYETRDHILKDILRHELAHFLTFIHYPTAKAHGVEFQETCIKYRWDKSISKSSMDIKTYKQDVVANLENERVLSKVKKLLNLASSTNEHEAELATVKANKLLLKHNLQFGELELDEENLYVKRVMKTKKRNSKISAIYDILKTFYVNPVLRYAKDGVYLEVCGTMLNIELSDYVTDFLDQKLDELWLKTKTEKKLKGLRAKNSFFTGLAKGYESKIYNSQSEFTEKEKKSLTIYRNKMDTKVRKIYKSLSSSSCNSSIDQNAFNSGKKVGISLSINKGLKSKTSKLLGYFS